MQKGISKVASFFCFCLCRIAAIAKCGLLLLRQCYRRSSVVGLCVCLSVGHIREPRINGWTKHDAVWGLIRVGPRNHVSDWVEIPHGKGQATLGVFGPLKCIGSIWCGLRQ